MQSQFPIQKVCVHPVLAEPFDRQEPFVLSLSPLDDARGDPERTEGSKDEPNGAQGRPVEARPGEPVAKPGPFA